MKKVALAVLFLVSVCAYSQSFKLYESSADYEEGDEITDETILSDTCVAQKDSSILYAVGELHLILENTSSSDKMVACKSKIVQIIEEAKADLCWGNCGYINEVVTEAIKVEANAKTYGFVVHYKAPIATVGSSIIRYTLYDEDDPNDSISVMFEFVTIPDLRTFVYANVPSLSVYPNPAVDYLTIEMSDLQLKQATFVLYDAIGRVVKTQLLTSNSTKMDVNNLEQGTYYLQILNDNKTIGVRKFVKE